MRVLACEDMLSARAARPDDRHSTCPHANHESDFPECTRRVTVASPYHEHVRRLLLGENGSPNAPGHTIAAAELALQRLREHLTRWMGADGFHAVVTRALANARVSHPLLAEVRIEPRTEVRLSELSGKAGAGDGELDESLVALVAGTLALLGRLIGDDLVMRLAHRAWPEAPDESRVPTRPDDERSQ